MCSGERTFCVELRFRIDPKNRGAQVGTGGDKIKGVHVVFVENENGLSVAIR